VGTTKIGCVMMVLATTLAVAACASPEPTIQTATDGIFEATVSVPPGVHNEADALGLVATLTYVGPDGSVTVDGDDEGFFWFRYRQLDGNREMGGDLSRLICGSPVTLLHGSSATFRPTRAVAYKADDPNAAFYQKWAADPDFRLPAGRWEIVAAAQIWDGETCIGSSPDHVISLAPLVVNVAP
jgi:hypothetical protein